MIEKLSKKEIKKKSKIWINENKGYIIGELKEAISDVEDEHYSTDGFFRSMVRRIEKWKMMREHDLIQLP